MLTGSPEAAEQERRAASERRDPYPCRAACSCGGRLAAGSLAAFRSGHGGRGHRSGLAASHKDRILDRSTEDREHRGVGRSRESLAAGSGLAERGGCHSTLEHGVCRGGVARGIPRGAEPDGVRGT